MANKKKKGRRQGIVSKLTNVGLIALGLSSAIARVFQNFSRPDLIAVGIVKDFTGYDTRNNTWELKRLAKGWTPVGAAVTLGMVKSYLLKKYPVRR